MHDEKGSQTNMKNKTNRQTRTLDPPLMKSTLYRRSQMNIHYKYQEQELLLITSFAPHTLKRSHPHQTQNIII